MEAGSIRSFHRHPSSIWCMYLAVVIIVIVVGMIVEFSVDSAYEWSIFREDDEPYRRYRLNYLEDTNKALR